MTPIPRPDAPADPCRPSAQGGPGSRLSIASKVGDLPPLPHVALRVLDLGKDPDASPKTLESEILRDPALVTRILKLANSPFYGMKATVSTVSRAILVVGQEKIRSLVLACCTESLFQRRHSGFKDKILWEHSLGVAFVSRFLAERLRSAPTEEAFIAGLVHDIGKVVMDANLGGDYQDVIEMVYNLRAESFVQAEHRVFGFDHTAVGALVAEQWALPPSIRQAVRHHHDRALSPEFAPLCAVVSLANGCCVKLELGPEKRPDLDLTTLPAAAALKVSATDLGALVDEIGELLTTEQSLFRM